MLLEFSVTNHKSIREKQTLSFLASDIVKKDRKKELVLENNIVEFRTKYILKSVAIWGANASGKTNVLKSFSSLLSFLSETMINSFNKFDGELYQPFLFDKYSKDKNSEFEIVFSVENITYTYFMSFNKDGIELESLYRNNRKAIFIREKNEIIKFSDKGYIKTTVINFLNSNRSVISICQLIESSEIFNIFSNLFPQVSIYNTLKINPFNMYSDAIAKKIEKYKINLLKILDYADFHINSFQLEQNEINEFDENISSIITPEQYEAFKTEIEKTQSLMFSHRVEEDDSSSDYTLNGALESEGTRKTISIGIEVLDTLKKGGLLCVDELEQSLHPFLCKFFINLFHNPNTNPNNAQLLFTTHSTDLLDSSIFRRDQIYFAKKTAQGTTELYSLQEFDKNQVRNNGNFQKLYLENSFEALPQISNSLYFEFDEEDK